MLVTAVRLVATRVTTFSWVEAELFDELLMGWRLLQDVPCPGAPVASRCAVPTNRGGWGDRRR